MSALALPELLAPSPLRPRRHLSLVPGPSRPVAPAGGSVPPPAGRSPVPAVRPAAARSGKVASVSAPVRVSVLGRRVLVVAVFVLAAALGALGGTLVSGSAQISQEVATVTVLPGDTLWSVAVGSGVATDDVRDLVAEIMTLNGLSDAVIVPGQVLVVPAAG